MSTDYIVCPALTDEDLQTARRLVADNGVTLLLNVLCHEVERVRTASRTLAVAKDRLARLARALGDLEREAESVEEDCWPDYAEAQRVDEAALAEESHEEATPSQEATP
jgi:hypothetical protein